MRNSPEYSEKFFKNFSSKKKKYFKILNKIAKIQKIGLNIQKQI